MHVMCQAATTVHMEGSPAPEGPEVSQDGSKRGGFQDPRSRIRDPMTRSRDPETISGAMDPGSRPWDPGSGGHQDHPETPRPPISSMG